MNKVKKMFLLGSLTAVATSSVGVESVLANNDEAVENEIVSQFTDVTERHEEAVKFMVSKGIKGVSSTMFGTNQNITRAQAAVFIANALELDLEKQPAHRLKDVPKYAENQVRALKALGVMNGINDKEFGSNQPLTRGQIALVVERLYELEGNPDNNQFKDVKGQYESAVAGMFDAGITTGQSKTEYGTSKSMTRGNFAIFLHRLNDLQTNEKVNVKFVELVNEKEIHLELDTYFSKVDVRAFEVKGYRLNKSRSTFSEVTLKGASQLEVTSKGKVIILKAKGDNIFPTGFERDFNIKLKEGFIRSLGTDLYNDSIDLNFVDNVLFEDVGEYKVVHKDNAAPFLLNAKADIEDRVLDVTFTESVKSSDNKSGFESINSANNGASISVVDGEQENQLSITFSKPVTNSLIDLNTIRLKVKEGAVVDKNENKVKEQVLVGIQKIKRKPVVDPLETLEKELSSLLRDSKTIEKQISYSLNALNYKLLVLEVENAMSDKKMLDEKTMKFYYNKLDTETQTIIKEESKVLNKLIDEGLRELNKLKLEVAASLGEEDEKEKTREFDKKKREIDSLQTKLNRISKYIK